MEFEVNMHHLSELLTKLGIRFERLGRRSEDVFIRIVPVAQSGEDCLAFINRPSDKTLELLTKASFAVMLLDSEWGMRKKSELNGMNLSIFLVEHPRLVFARIMRLLYPDEDRFDAGIHPTANVHPEAVIHPTVSIGQGCIVGKCQIGENSRIHAYTIVKDDVIIGKNVTIRENCLIGGCGFGFVRDETDRLVRIPHIGGVIIEDDVELFPYVNVDRGTLGETVIKKGAKIDHYAHIGHNSSVGENSIITAGTVFCGGSSIGKRSWAGVGSIIKEKISVGDDVTLGLGSIVIDDIKNDTVAAGNPAKPIIKEP
jgi:UDP-3-O-[3-hydroxymyristoyl] glucosamine N-acyltransferase